MSSTSSRGNGDGGGRARAPRLPSRVRTPGGRAAGLPAGEAGREPVEGEAAPGIAGRLTQSSEARRACGRPPFIHALFERTGLPIGGEAERLHIGRDVGDPERPLEIAEVLEDQEHAIGFKLSARF